MRHCYERGETDDSFHLKGTEQRLIGSLKEGCEKIFISQTLLMTTEISFTQQQSRSDVNNRLEAQSPRHECRPAYEPIHRFNSRQYQDLVVRVML